MNAINMCNKVIVKNIKLILCELTTLLIGYWLYVVCHKNLVLLVVGLCVAFFYIAFNKSVYEIVRGNNIELKKILEYSKKNIVKFVFVAIMFITCFFSLVICAVLIFMNTKGFGLAMAIPLVMFAIICTHLTMLELCINQANIGSVIKNVYNKIKKNIAVCLFFGIIYIVIVGIAYGAYSLLGINIAIVIEIVLVVYVNILFSVVYFQM